MELFLVRFSNLNVPINLPALYSLFINLKESFLREKKEDKSINHSEKISRKIFDSYSIVIKLKADVVIEFIRIDRN